MMDPPLKMTQGVGRQTLAKLQLGWGYPRVALDGILLNISQEGWMGSIFDDPSRGQQCRLSFLKRKNI